ncbi:MAG TPA: response regulator [Candidatus Obscuribacterales bacterium]
MRILVAEDNLTLRWLFVQQLEKLGAQCDCAANGQDAVDWFEKRGGDYALILMDVMMPDVDGYEAARQIREAERSQNLPRTPMVALTCVDEPADCLAAGMDAHCRKPIFPQHFNEIVKKWAGKSPDESITIG